MVFESGPYVIAAAFCEQLVQETTGALTLFRLVTGINQTGSGPSPSDVMPPVPSRLKLVVKLAPGRLRGRHDLKLIPQLPSGEIGPPALQSSIHFHGEADAEILEADVSFSFEMEGLHWFILHFDGVPLTRIPFNLRYIPDPTMRPRT